MHTLQLPIMFRKLLRNVKRERYQSLRDSGLSALRLSTAKLPSPYLSGKQHTITRTSSTKLSTWKTESLRLDPVKIN